MRGPLDLKIGYRHQPPIVKDWPKGRPIVVRLEQPDERTNLTIIRLGFSGTSNPSADSRWDTAGKWYNINQYRLRKTNILTCYIKGRITDKMEHPIPVGQYEGTCEWGESWCLFILQAVTMVLKQEEPRIVLPDGSLPGKGKTRIALP